MSACVQTQDEDRIQVLRVEQRSPEAENVLNLVLDMAEEKIATAKEKARGQRFVPSALARACICQTNFLKILRSFVHVLSGAGGLVRACVQGGGLAWHVACLPETCLKKT